MRNTPSQYLPGASLLLAVAAMALLLPWLGETAFNSKGEPREAIVAVTMLQSGNWVLPVSYGCDIPFKPPFMAWLIAAFSWLFNGGHVSEYLSRLPSALAGIALVMTGYAWASRVRGQRFGFIVGMVTLTSVEVFRAAVACRNDMILTACMVSALYLLYGLQENRKARNRGWKWFGALLLLSCAVLTKGPVGSLLPCFVAGMFYLFRGDRFFPTLGKMLGLAVGAMVIPAVWYYAAYLQGGQPFVDLMLEENIGRLTGSMSYSSHVKPFWYNFLTILAGMSPWTLLAVFGVFAIGKWRRSPLKPSGLFAVLAVVIIVGFYCIPESKRSVYLLPAYPFMAYAIASILYSEEGRIPTLVFTWVVAVLSILAPVAVGVLQFYPVGNLTLDPIDWWDYAVLLVPVVFSVLWMLYRTGAPLFSCWIVWSMLFVYSAVVMPAVLNPRSDIKAVERLTETDAKVLTLEHEKGYRNYTLNFYLDDSIRPVESLRKASYYPSGTKVLVSEHADTTGLSENFKFENLLQRSCDHRERLGLAIKK